MEEIISDNIPVFIIKDQDEFKIIKGTNPSFLSYRPNKFKHFWIQERVPLCFPLYWNQTNSKDSNVQLKEIESVDTKINNLIERLNDGHFLKTTGNEKSPYYVLMHLNDVTPHKKIENKTLASKSGMILDNNLSPLIIEKDGIKNLLEIKGTDMPLRYKIKGTNNNDKLGEMTLFKFENEISGLRNFSDCFSVFYSNKNCSPYLIRLNPKGNLRASYKKFQGITDLIEPMNNEKLIEKFVNKYFQILNENHLMVTPHMENWVRSDLKTDDNYDYIDYADVHSFNDIGYNQISNFVKNSIYMLDEIIKIETDPSEKERLQDILITCTKNKLNQTDFLEPNFNYLNYNDFINHLSEDIIRYIDSQKRLQKYS